MTIRDDFSIVIDEGYIAGCVSALRRREPHIYSVRTSDKRNLTFKPHKSSPHPSQRALIFSHFSSSGDEAPD